MKLLPDPTDRETLVSLLLLGEVLTRRGENGPLRRVWSPAARPRVTIPREREMPLKEPSSGKTE